MRRIGSGDRERTGVCGLCRSIWGCCNTLEACELDDGAFGAPHGALCSNYCAQVVTFIRYWQCEPLYREYLSCIRRMDMCNLSECNDFGTTFNDCLTPPQPNNANSCIFANNDTCDEPDRCVTGSDSNDCDR